MASSPRQKEPFLVDITPTCCLMNDVPVFPKKLSLKMYKSSNCTFIRVCIQMHDAMLCYRTNKILLLCPLKQKVLLIDRSIIYYIDRQTDIQIGRRMDKHTGVKTTYTLHVYVHVHVTRAHPGGLIPTAALSPLYLLAQGWWVT